MGTGELWIQSLGHTKLNKELTHQPSLSRSWWEPNTLYQPLCGPGQLEVSLLTAGGLEEMTFEAPFQPSVVCETSHSSFPGEPLSIPHCPTVWLQGLSQQLEEAPAHSLRGGSEVEVPHVLSQH